MTLNNRQKQYLKNLAHHIKPIVLLGNNGLTEQVISEINHSLEYHELIKVKLIGEDRASRQTIAQEINHRTASESIQLLGNILTLYRPGNNKKINIPK